MRRSHFLPDLLDHLFDVAGVLENSFQPFDNLRFVADVLFHNVDGIVENFINRHGHSAMDGFDTLLRRVCFLRCQQFECIQRNCDVPGKDLQELQIAFSESTGIWALNVKCSDDLVVPGQRDRQRAFGTFEAFEVERI